MMNVLADPNREFTSATPKGMGRIEIDLRLLADIMLFPEGSKIISVRQHPEREGFAEIIVEGEGLPATLPGDPICRVNPQYKRVFASHPEFVSWDYH